MRAARVLVSFSVVVAALLAPSAAWATDGDDGATPPATEQPGDPPPWAVSSCRGDAVDPAPDECRSWRDQHKALMVQWREERAGIMAQWRAGELTTQERDALLAQGREERQALMADLRAARAALQEAWRLAHGAQADDPDPAEADDPDGAAEADDGVGTVGGHGHGNGGGHGHGNGNGHGNGHGHGQGNGRAG